MTEEWKRSQATIGHLKLRSRTADTNVPALRLRTEHLLNNIDLQPRGLPPGSLLLVQKVYVSMPLSSSTSPQSRWAEQLHAQMETLYRTSARPALGPVPSNAASVLFTDVAEMLAYLTRDLLNRRAWQHWYWQRVLRHVPRVPHAPGSALAAAWSEHATFVPAMLDYLQIEELHAAIALLTLPEVSRVIASLNAGFALSSPVSTPIPIANDQLSEASHPHHDGLPPEVPAPEQTSGIPLPIRPPWQRWLAPLQVTSLPPQAQYLLGLIVTLHHAPSFARSAEFMSRALSWLQAEQEREPIVEESIAANQRSFSTAQAPVTNHPAANQHSFSPAPAPVTNHPAATSTTRDVIFGAAQPFPSEGLLTGLGGVLYLVNVLKWLDLPASWEASGTWGTLAEYLGSWAIIELLARGLLDAMVEEYAADPMWNVLAMLDKREPGALIGANLPPRTAFRLPAAWLARYGKPHFSWTVATDGLHLYLVDGDAGYLVVDVPLEGRSMHEVIAAEIDAYRAQDIDVTVQVSHNPALNSLHHYLSALVHPNALWWLERMIGFIRYLLVRALSEPAIDEHSLPEALLCKHGRLIAGRTHVDLYMPMDQVSLGIRRAGLDRDPGWVPDLGHIVLFHFGQEI